MKNPFVAHLLVAGVLTGICAGGVMAQQKKKFNGAEVLAPEVQQGLFHVPEGFVVELIAAEPAVINPITMALDEQGRIYVTEGHTYRYGPKGSPVEKPTNPIVRLDPAPDGKGWKRTVVAEGFADPVMGLLIRDGKMWCTACDHLYVYDLDDKGVATNRKEIVRDKSKAWNPFGFFVLERGPEDLIYVSVGNHGMDLVGPTNSLNSRGASGIVMRMKEDGSNMEKLVEGLRVPYSIEFDPYGQLWVLSNGQGNPDRFVKVIAGVDYHCYSRPKANNLWLAGKHALAPPCIEITNGARTQLLHYYGAAFPESFQGWQLGVNWGPHGVGIRNHALEEFVPDSRERNTKTSNWLTCDDPRFRPTQIMLAPDGNLLVADWYGRDDENDLTGRIWKVKYVGQDAPKVVRLAENDWNDMTKVVGTLGSPDHLQRERAIKDLAKRGNAVVKQVAEYAAKSDRPLGAANALWVLARIGTPEAKAALSEGMKNTAWKVRRLSLRLLRRYQVAETDAVAAAAANDPDPAVRLESALARTNGADLRKQLLQVLAGELAGDPHLRYEAASHLARHADDAAFAQLLGSPDANVRLAGLIALDVALYEKTPTAELARKVLHLWIDQPGAADLGLIVDLAILHPDPSMIPAIQKLLTQPKLAPSIIADASKLLRILAGTKGIKNPWIESLKSGKITLNSLEDKQIALSILPDEGPTPFGVGILCTLIDDSNAALRSAACSLARQWGDKANPAAPSVWKALLNNKLPSEVRIELASTAASIGLKADAKNWAAALKDADLALTREIIRQFRRYPKDQELLALVNEYRADLVKRDESIKQDLALTLAALGTAGTVSDLGSAVGDAKDYREFVQKNHQSKPSSVQLALGRAVFERASCVKCHTLDTENKTGPTLGGVGRHELNHVIESILEPSKVILTGYEVERIETINGVILTGMVREKGDTLTIIVADKTETLPKSQVAERAIIRQSIMPEGTEKIISRDEFVDLLAFLMTQKANVGPAPPKKK